MKTNPLPLSVQRRAAQSMTELYRNKAASLRGSPNPILHTFADDYESRAAFWETEIERLNKQEEQCEPGH